MGSRAMVMDTHKSYVSMEAAVCPACGREHETGALLLDRRLRPRFERVTVTGWEPCETCQGHIDDGRVILVAIEEPATDLVRPEDAIRTGALCYIREAAFEHVFDVPIPPRRIAFIDGAVLELLTGSHETEKGDRDV